MLTLLGINKILAIYVGPAGYGVIGQFQNILQMITTISSGAINNGVVRYTAEYEGDNCKQRNVWRTAGTISIITTIVVGFLIFILNEFLAEKVLNNQIYSDVFIYLSITLILFVFNSLFLSVLNGKKEINRYIIANITGSIFSLAITSMMVYAFGLHGALIALVTSQGLVFFVTLYMCRNATWFRFQYFFGKIDKNVALDFSKYTIMALTSALCLPLSHSLVRANLGDDFGWDVAGYWEAMWRLSSAYLLIITTTLSIYYLPKLSEIKETATLRKEVLSGYKIILPVVIVFGMLIYFSRYGIIQILFSSEFYNMEVLFFWQIIGDTLKICSWLLGYILIAKAHVKAVVVSEIAFSILFVTLVNILSKKLGVEGAAISHAICYLFHLIFVFSYLRFRHVI